MGVVVTMRQKVKYLCLCVILLLGIGCYSITFMPTASKLKVKLPSLLWKNENKSDQLLTKLLRNAPLPLQRKMLAGTPLSCYPGKEGIFPNKYGKLLHVFLAYSQLHHSMSTNSSHARTLVWQCRAHTVCGGLADRLKGMTLAILLAMFSHRRLVLDFEDCVERAYMKPNLINWADNHLFDVLRHHMGNITSRTVSFSLLEARDKPHLGMSLADWEKYLKIISGEKQYVVMVTNMEVSLISNLSKAHQTWLREGFDLAGLSQLSDHELDDILGLVFRYLFKLDKKLLKEVSKAKKKLGLTGQRYVGVHIRSGFFKMKSGQEGSHPKLLVGENNLKTALQCAVSTANKFIGNESLIFLATDSNFVKEMASKLNGPRFRTLKHNIVHVSSVKSNSNNKNTAAAMTTLIDLLLLAESYVQVRGASGYSWVAGLLCGPLPNEHLIDSITCKTDDLNVIHI